MKRNTIIGLSLAILLLSFGLIRYAFYFWHHLAQWPLLMLGAGIAGLIVSYLFHRPWASLVVGIGYSLGLSSLTFSNRMASMPVVARQVISGSSGYWPISSSW